MEYEIPKAILTLKRAEDQDKTVWVTETHDQVRNMVANAVLAGEPLITFTRVVGGHGKLFSTRPDNVVSVEAND
jgi:hypothetical protein